jgi:hypothetical protein
MKDTCEIGKNAYSKIYLYIVTFTLETYVQYTSLTEYCVTLAFFTLIAHFFQLDYDIIMSCHYIKKNQKIITLMLKFYFHVHDKTLTDEGEPDSIEVRRQLQQLVREVWDDG